MGRMKKMKIGLKRKLIQIAAFGLSNLHMTNLGKGKIYTGPWKNFCNPGLHCYSCPAATAACPIGALQAVTGSMNFNFSFYVVGFLLAVGVILGRFVCGFLCPFGLVQDLLHKIPLPKLRLPGWMKYVKYAFLVIFVLLMPVVAVNVVGMGDPAFCQYICPSGMLFGAIPLMGADEALRSAAGGLFVWKCVVLAAVVIGSILIFRFFCKLLCPLGAIYGILNKISLYSLKVDESKCIHCGKCASVCLMDVNPVKTPNSAECIRCGACREACPAGAISIGFGIARKKDRQKTSGCDGKCTGCPHSCPSAKEEME